MRYSFPYLKYLLSLLFLLLFIKELHGQETNNLSMEFISETTVDYNDSIFFAYHDRDYELCVSYLDLLNETDTLSMRSIDYIALSFIRLEKYDDCINFCKLYGPNYRLESVKNTDLLLSSYFKNAVLVSSHSSFYIAMAVHSSSAKVSISGR